MDDGSEDDLPVKRRRGKRHEQVRDAPPLAPCVPSVPSVDEDVDDASPVKRVRGKRRLQAAAEATVPTDPVVAKRRGRLRQQATQDGAEEELPKSMLRNGFSSSRPEEEEEEEDDEAAEEFYQSMLRDEMPSSRPVRTTAFKCSELPPSQETRTQRARRRLPVEEEEEEEDDDEEFYQSMLRDEMPSSRPVRLTRSNRERRAAGRFEEEEEDDDDAAEELAQSMLRNTSSTSNPQRSETGRRRGRRKERPEPKRIIYADEVPWPVPKKKKGDSGEEDEDSEVERARRQEGLLQRMRQTVEKGRARLQQSSHEVDVQALKDRVLAPRFSFDWPEENDSQETPRHEECVLEVLPPDDICPRQLLKEQLDHQMQKELAKGLVVAKEVGRKGG